MVARATDTGALAQQKVVIGRRGDEMSCRAAGRAPVSSCRRRRVPPPPIPHPATSQARHKTPERSFGRGMSGDVSDKIAAPHGQARGRQVLTDHASKKASKTRRAPQRTDRGTVDKYAAHLPYLNILNCRGPGGLWALCNLPLERQRSSGHRPEVRAGDGWRAGRKSRACDRDPAACPGSGRRRCRA